MFFKKLIEDAEETLQDATLLLSLAQAEAEAEEDEQADETHETIQDLRKRVMARLDRPPGEAFSLLLHLTPTRALYPRTRWALDTALSRCAAHPQGGLLVVACSPVLDRAQICALVEARARSRLGADALRDAHLSETSREGLALTLLVGHVPGHRVPDLVDAEPQATSTDQLLNDEDVSRFVYTGSPRDLSAEDTLLRYGLTAYDRNRRGRAPTLAAQIAFAGRPGLRGLAFEVTTGRTTRPIRDLPLRRLCDRVIELVQAEDSRVDPSTLRQMLLYAVVQRSWRADVRDAPMEVDVGASIDVRFPGSATTGWIRNELLLQLVRRNTALGWDAAAVGFDHRSAGGRTTLSLKRRTPTRPVAAKVAKGKAADKARPAAAAPARSRPAPSRPKTPTPTPGASGESPPRTLPVITSYGPEMKAFLDEVMVLDPNALIDNPELSGAFATWCRQHGAVDVPSQRWLALRLKAYGFRQAPGRTAGVRRWRGLRLRTGGTDMRDT